MNAIMDFSEVLELKKAVSDNCDIYLHFHDACGGQYFEFDEPVGDDVVEFLNGYFAPYNLTTFFADNRLTFTVGEIPQE